MNLSRTILCAGTLPLLAGPIYLIGRGVGVSPSSNQPAACFVSVVLGLGFTIAGAALIALAQKTERARALARASALGLAGLWAGTAVTTAAMAVFVGRAFSVAGESPPETISVGIALLVSVGFMATAASIWLMSAAPAERSRTGSGALFAMVVLVTGLGAAVTLLCRLEPSGTRSDLVLTSVMFPLIGLGLLAASGVELQHVRAAGGFLPNCRASAALGAGIGLLALAAMVISTLNTQAVDEHRRHEELAEVQRELREIEHLVLQAALAPIGTALDNREPETIDDWRARLKRLNGFTPRPDQSVPLARLMDGIEGEIAGLRLQLTRSEQPRSTVPLGLPLAVLRSEMPFARLWQELPELGRALDREVTEQKQNHAGTQRRAVMVLAVTFVGLLGLLGVVEELFARDTASRQTSEAALSRHNETLKHFAHTVAHDLRAPLRGIAGYAAELDSYADVVDGRGRHCITQIKTAAHILERLIGDTLEYARLDGETPRLTPVELPALVATLLQQRATEIKLNGAQIYTNFGVTTVIGWERGLVQIVGNLLDNAIKYSRHAQPPRLRIETALTPLSWRLLIYDNGIGFDMKYHDRIFGLFQRLVSADEFEGTGAGLAIVRKITDRLGGTVCAEGRPGGGATFLVELPLIPSHGLT